MPTENYGHRLAVVVPTRGRPGNIRKVISAWDFTNAWDVAHLVLAVDADDPEYQGYVDLFEETRHPDTNEALFSLVTMDRWMPMVHKLNVVAENLALTRLYLGIGFAGDDHLPRTMGWAQRYLAVLGELGTGMVYGDDGYQGVKLSTEWAVTADAVRALGRMVPAQVEHMYCDNSMMDLYGGAGAMRHLPEVRIEHMHPVVGKADNDEQYRKVNHRSQFTKDRQAYERWRSDAREHNIRAIRDLRAGYPDVPLPVEIKPPVRPARQGRAISMHKVPGLPRHFKRVRGATPADIEITLADFARTIPADQEIVELGVFQGRTSLIMAWGASQGHGAHVTGIDAWDLEGNTYDPPFTDPGSEAWARHHVQTLGFSNKVILVKGFAVDLAIDWGKGVQILDRTGVIGDGKKVGLLFVDDDHSKEGCRRAIEAWAPHLADGAIIAVDDHGHPDWPGVAEAVAELVAEGLIEEPQIYHDRLAVTRLAVKVPETPTEDQFADLPVLDVTAITSEGVATSPTVPGQVAAEEEAAPPPATDWKADKERLGQEWRAADPKGVAALDASSRLIVGEGELPSVNAGVPITGLPTQLLRDLAKVRGVVLGADRQRKPLILQALREGK
jgi:predicted O-methyltransferase YrrM